jgi:hypothetical protein
MRRLPQRCESAIWHFDHLALPTLIDFQVFLLTEYLQDSRKYIMGHETAGEVVALGSAVSPSDVKIGKLYAVMAINPCVKSIVSPILSSFGIGFNGGYAEYAVAKVTQLVPVVSLITTFSKDDMLLTVILWAAGKCACPLCSRHGRRWCHCLQGYHEECAFLQNVWLHGYDV